MFHPKLLSVFVHGNTVLSVAQTQTLELLSALLAVSELLQLAKISELKSITFHTKLLLFLISITEHLLKHLLVLSPLLFR
jgi:hypothetical protein